MLIRSILKYYSPSANEGASNAVVTTENCEYYFMLYIDNELTDTEKKLVEGFLVKNPSFQNLFASLQNTTLHNNDISFNAKQNLYKETIITEANYETYALLALDNELTKEEAEKFASFLQQNPEVTTTLNLFNKTKLVADSFSPYNKTLLLRLGSTIFPNTATLAEALTLYVDGETNATQNIAINNLQKTDTTVAKEITLLQQTKLSPTNISFPNKEVLYKKEAKVRKLVPIWLRYAAAACLVLLITIPFINTKKTEPTPKNTIATTPTINTNKTNTVVQGVPPSLPFTNSTQQEKNTIVTNNKNNLQNNISTLENVKNNNTTVKIKLNEKNIVTTASPQRITNNDDVVKNKTDLNFNEKEAIENMSLTTNLVATNIKVNEEQQKKLAELKSSVAQSNILNTNYTAPVEENNDVAIMNIDAAKIDKTGKAKKLKTKINSFFQQKLKNISNSSLNVGKYEIVLASSR